MRQLTIAPVTSIDMKAALSVFAAGFGLVWLFVEPLGFFGLIPHPVRPSGIWWYATMLLTGIVASVTLIRGHRWLNNRKTPFISFVIRSASDAGDHFVRGSANMQVGDFLHEFLKALSKGPARARIDFLRRNHIPILQVARDGTFVDIDSNLSLREAGIRDGDICQIRAQPDPNFNLQRFSCRPVQSEP